MKELAEREAAAEEAARKLAAERAKKREEMKNKTKMAKVPAKLSRHHPERPETFQRSSAHANKSPVGEEQSRARRHNAKRLLRAGMIWEKSRCAYPRMVRNDTRERF